MASDTSWILNHSVDCSAVMPGGAGSAVEAVVEGVGPDSMGVAYAWVLVAVAVAVGVPGVDEEPVAVAADWAKVGRLW